MLSVVRGSQSDSESRYSLNFRFVVACVIADTGRNQSAFEFDQTAADSLRSLSSPSCC